MKTRKIYRQIIVALLLSAFLLQAFSKALIVTDYFADRTTYLANCENKSRPQLNCNGQCILMKKLQKEENRDQKNPERKAENKTELPSSTKSFFCIKLVPAETALIIKKGMLISTGNIVDQSFDIFHPPRFS